MFGPSLPLGHVRAAGAVQLAMSVCVLASRVVASAGAEHPNVVLIYADDLGYGDVGCYGATKVKTPNIDRLAREGRRFTDANAASSVCSPSRYSLLTGEYAYRCRHGMRGRWMPVNHMGGLIIDQDQYTLGRLFQDAGFHTACIGKWHLGFGQSPTDWSKPLRPGPLETGFDYFYGVPKVNSGPPYVYVEDHHVVGDDPDDPLRYDKEHPTPVKEYPEKVPNYFGGAQKAHALYVDEELAANLTARSIDWIKSHVDRPFFLYFATTNIHHPYTPAPRFRQTSECGLYGDSIHELDWIVGQILDTLDKAGLADNTIVVFASDNGGMLSEGGHQAWKMGHRPNGELLGFKFGAWEGGHRVPLIVRWPGRIPAGTVSGQLICQTDLLATFAHIVHRELRPGQARDSINVLAAMTGDPQEPCRKSAVLGASKASHVAIRDGDWLYIGAQGSGGFGNGLFSSVFRGRPLNSDIGPDSKIKADAPSAQLYNLATDPFQRTNVVLAHPEIVQRLRAVRDQVLADERTE